MNEPRTGSSRRDLLRLWAMVPAAASLATMARAAEPGTCVDFDVLPASQKSMRKSLGFVVHTDDTRKRCATCTFFADAGTCGKCQLLSGGAVAPDSVCGSWATKS